ncbi:MAG: SAF domain-containing protein [Gammaproteobacteria bacterium]
MRARRTRGGATILIMTVVISGALTSILGIRQVQRITTEPQWVASADLIQGQIISRSQLVEVRAKSDEFSVKAANQIIGKILTEDKSVGEPFYASDFTAPPKSWLAQKVPEGRVLYTLVPHNNTIPYTLLRNGDRFDVLVTGRRGVRTVAQDVQLIGALAAKGSKTDDSGRNLITRLTSSSNSESNEDNGDTPLIIAVKPGEIYPLASISESDMVSLVLHGETEVRDGELLNINPMAASGYQIEVFNGQERSQVYFGL